MTQESSRRLAGRLIVKFEQSPADSNETLLRRCEALLEVIPKGRIIRPPGRSGRAVISVDPNADLRRLALDVSEREGIEYAEPDVTDSEA